MFNNETNNDDNDDLVPDSYIEAINLETQLHPDEVNNQEKMARRLMRESLPAITMMVTRTALTDPDPRVRLTASTMVFDRVLGKAGTIVNAEVSPHEELYHSIVVEIESMLSAN